MEQDHARIRASLEAKGHSFRGFPLRCAGCGMLIGVLSAFDEKAPACRSALSSEPEER